MDRTDDFDLDELVEDLSDTSETRSRGPLFRFGQITLGIILVLAGIVMSGPGIPGPGLIVIVAGLNLIKPNNRIYRWLRRRTPGLPDEGPIPRRTLVIGVAFAVVLIAASTTISILYGAQITGWIQDTLGIDLPSPF